MNKCLICNRKLKSEESIKRGIGSTCFARLNKIIKEDRERKHTRQKQFKREKEIAKEQINLFDYITTKENTNAKD